MPSSFTLEMPFIAENSLAGLSLLNDLQNEYEEMLEKHSYNFLGTECSGNPQKCQMQQRGKSTVL